MKPTVEELYAAEVSAYRAYVEASAGSALVTAQRVSPAKVARLQNAWYEARLALTNAYTRDDVRAMFERKAARNAKRAR